MTAPVDREKVQAFYAAYAAGDPVRLEPFLHGDVVWTVSGPVNLLHYCGERHGKAKVLELFRSVLPDVLRAKSFVCKQLLIDGDHAATLGRLTAELTATGHPVAYRCAHFLHFVDSKVIEFHSIIDSFDAAEQVLGHRIDVTQAPPLASELDDDLVLT